jgi:uncharacterized membrane protein YsdA (DUF1294 family)/cold shock CspA family protein
MRVEGVIKSWNDDRGFGFIEPLHGGQEIFVHIKAFARAAGRPQVNQIVSFEIELDPKGKKRARNVEPIRSARAHPRLNPNSPAQWGTATLFAIPAFLALYIVVGVTWKPPNWVAGIYLALSVLTFGAYWLDKSSSARGGWRTPERTLHALALAGGWPGALIAQQFLRHKSTKTEFRSAFWGTVVANVAAFVLLSSPAGRAVLAGH